MAETDAYMVDFEEELGWFTFGFKGDKRAFYDALKLLKGAVPSAEREFDMETKLWTVLVTPENEETLADIFENGASVILQARSQMSLF